MRLSRVLLACLGVGAGACGARSELFVPEGDASVRDVLFDAREADAPVIDAREADVPVDTQPDVQPDVPIDVPRDEQPDVPVDDGPPRECTSDAQCDNGRFCDGAERCEAGFCVRGSPPVCDDRDPCTGDRCDEDARACATEPLTRDRDGDGHRGVEPGLPAVCGDDCDDANERIFPGAREVCNAVDDNCNGAVDEGTTLAPSGVDVPISELSMNPTGVGGITWAGDRWATSYYGYDAGKARVYFSSRRRDGTPARTPAVRRLSTADEADAFGAALVWTGDTVGALWQDRRGGDFEMYFNRLTPDGDKLGPDQRLTFEGGFSINGSLAFNGVDYFTVWQDARLSGLGESNFEIFAQRIDREGRQVEDNLQITDAPRDSESPIVAAADDGSYGIVWIDGRSGPPSNPANRGVYFARYNASARRVVADVRISPAGQVVVQPVIAWARDRWVVAWYDNTESSTSHEVWGTALRPDGTVLVPPRALTSDPNFSRYPSLVSLADGVLLVWADDRGGDGYDVYARRFSPALAPLGAELRVTRAMRDSVYPIAALGADGEVGVLFRDQRVGRWEVRFTSLRCAAP